MIVLWLIASAALIALLAIAPTMDPRAHRHVTTWCAGIWIATSLLEVMFR